MITHENGATNSATTYATVSDPFSVPALTVFRSALEFSPLVLTRLSELTCGAFARLSKHSVEKVSVQRRAIYRLGDIPTRQPLLSNWPFMGCVR